LKYFPENNAHPLGAEAYYLTKLTVISRDQTETSHPHPPPPSITSDVQFLPRGKGWAKYQKLRTSYDPLTKKCEGAILNDVRKIRREER
jgi:hypothetical protein